MAHAIEQFVGGLSGFWLFVVIAFSIGALTWSADRMVDGAVHLARRTGLPRVFIGATVVALGTSLPETFVSVTAAWMGNPGLALGNGVGSVICDTGLIFGLTCVLSPLPANRFILNRTGFVQVGAATLLVAIAIYLKLFTSGPPMLSRGVGLLFMLLLAAYLYISYGWSKQSAMVVGEPPDGELPPMVKSIIMVLAGLVGVILSSRTLIPAAVEMAGRLGVPDDVIAATLVAFGTSLPELATALVSVKKGYPSIMLGTVVGSDVLNILFVVGASALARPLAIPNNFYYFHFPAMLVILYVFRWFIIKNKNEPFTRIQGGVILSCYALYLILQFAFNMGQ